MVIQSTLKFLRQSKVRIRRSRLLGVYSRLRGDRRAKKDLWYLALRLCDQSVNEAKTLYSQWLTEGFCREGMQAIATSVPAADESLQIPQHHRLRVLSGSTLKWTSHAWLQHLPVHDLQQLEKLKTCHDSSSRSEQTTLLLLDSGLEESRLPVETLLRWKQEIEHTEQCIVREPALAALLRGMGLKNVRHWRYGDSTNGWLEQVDVLTHASSQMGLPPAVGLPEALPMVLGDAGPSWQCSLNDQLMSIPGWDFLLINSGEDARSQAAWLQSLSRNGHNLIALNPKQQAEIQAGLDALEGSTIRTVLNGEFCQTALLNELEWRLKGCPAPKIGNKPQPVSEVIWEQKSTIRPNADLTVCISLYNYGHTIQRALESVRHQTIPKQSIDLIVVDDSSTDEGAERVMAWMKHYGHNFHRCRLIQHKQNGGLAAARNTAFQHADSDWCFVLDADNLLRPSALTNCLTMARSASKQCRASMDCH